MEGDVVEHVGPTKPIVDPRRGSLSVTFSVPPDADTVLQQVVDQYAAKYVTVFEVKHMGNRLVVMPAKVRDKSGKLIQHTPSSPRQSALQTRNAM